jgi:branched-chain amino acid transport system permease protein
MDPSALFVVQCLNSLSLAALLFFIALGLTLIFGIMRIINFAHGAVYMFGAYVGVTAFQLTGSFWAAVVCGPLAAAVLGVVFEWAALRFLYGRDGSAYLLVTFGLALMLTEAIRFLWGPEGRHVELPESLAGIVEIMGEPYPTYRLFLIGAGFGIAIGIWAFLMYTRAGLLIRATAQNPTMTHALGLDVQWIRRGVFGIACALAALGGVLATPLITAFMGMGTLVVIDAFVIVMIGGMGSFVGSAVGSLLVGFSQTFGNFYFPDIALGATYALMILVLLIRPGGLFGAED